MNKLDEIRLISRCILSDDRQAFGELVEAYQPSLRRFLLNLTLGDTALSDDLAQETFIKAYFSIRQFKGIASFKTWLFRIAYNEFFSEMRKTKTLRLDDISNNDPPDCPHNSSEARMDVMAAMAVLSPIERSCISLFYIDDVPIKKIAAITSMPEGSVKSHLFRAKAKMKNILEYQNKQL